MKTNKVTDEISHEIDVRIAENPTSTRRIGNFGFIELEDTWGDESTILNTARISTTNNRVKSPADFTKKDTELLYQLLKNAHGTPFETVYFRFRFIAPIFVLRQWVKHRVSSWNEFSMRYRNPIQEFYIPDAKARSVNGFELLSEKDVEEYTELLDGLNAWYEKKYAEIGNSIDSARVLGILPDSGNKGRDPYRGRARELLRNAMPVAAYSDVYWTVNFRSLMNFFKLRMKDSAQYEIREYANASFDLFAQKFPLLAKTMERVIEDIYEVV
jgi:thymidylate synthase (FAD)